MLLRKIYSVSVNLETFQRSEASNQDAVLEVQFKVSFCVGVPVTLAMKEVAVAVVNGYSGFVLLLWILMLVLPLRTVLF